MLSGCWKRIHVLAFPQLKGRSFNKRPKAFFTPMVSLELLGPQIPPDGLLCSTWHWNHLVRGCPLSVSKSATLSGKGVPKTDPGLAKKRIFRNGPSTKTPFAIPILNSKKGGWANPNYYWTSFLGWKFERAFFVGVGGGKFWQLGQDSQVCLKQSQGPSKTDNLAHSLMLAQGRLSAANRGRRRALREKQGTERFAVFVEVLMGKRGKQNPVQKQKQGGWPSQSTKCSVLKRRV